MKKRFTLIMVMVLLVNLLTGCNDSFEVDDRIFAVTVGFDKGMNNKTIITVQYPSYKSSQEGGGGMTSQSSISNVESIEAPGVVVGIEFLSTVASRRISLVHAKMLVVSEEVARRGIRDIVSPLARYRESRRTALMVITKGRAMDFIRENKSSVGDSLAKNIELIGTQSKYTGYYPFVKFHDFYRKVVSTYSDPVAVYAGLNEMNKISLPGKQQNKVITEPSYLPGEIPRQGEKKTEFAGSAVFHGDKMVGTLTPAETRYMLIITNEFKQGVFAINDRKSPNNIIAFIGTRGRPSEVKVHFKNGIPIIDVNLEMEAEISAIQSRINYESVKEMQDLDEQIKNYFENGVTKLLRKSQKELKADVFSFGEKAAGNFDTIQEWEKYGWSKHYPEAKINVTVKANVRRTGNRIYSSPIQNKLDEDVD